MSNIAFCWRYSRALGLGFTFRDVRVVHFIDSYWLFYKLYYSSLAFKVLYIPIHLAVVKNFNISFSEQYSNKFSHNHGLDQGQQIEGWVSKAQRNLILFAFLFESLSNEYINRLPFCLNSNLFWRFLGLINLAQSYLCHFKSIPE